MMIILEIISATIIQSIFILPTLAVPVFFIVLALRKKTAEGYPFEIPALVSSLLGLLGVYSITVGFGSHDAQSALGLVFLPFVSFIFAIISLHIALFLKTRPFRETLYVHDDKVSKRLIGSAFLVTVILSAFTIYVSYKGSFGYLAARTKNQDLIVFLEDQAGKQGDEVTMLMLAQNFNTPADVLVRLASYSPDYILIHISSNPNAPLGLIMDFAKSDSQLVSKFAKRNLEKRLAKK